MSHLQSTVRERFLYEFSYLLDVKELEEISDFINTELAKQREGIDDDVKNLGYKYASENEPKGYAEAIVDVLDLIRSNQQL